MKAGPVSQPVFMGRAAMIGFALLLAPACSTDAPEQADDDAWVGTVTSEGDVTTVINESGSVWGGAGRLVEELSIGVESGDEPYLFGNVAGLGFAEERIFVLDAQIHRVRVYDADGAHVMDLGGEGDGPGEFRRPTGLAVGQDRVYVRDPQTGRITVFSTAGGLLDTWPTEAYFTSTPIVATTSGQLYVQYGRGMVQWGPDGQTDDVVPFPEVSEPPPRMMVRVTEAIPGYSRGAMLARAVPFWPLPAFAMSATGAMIHGVGQPYRFSIAHPNGAVTHVERSAEPVPVAADEAAWYRSRVAEFLRQADAGWQWDGPEVPATKPAFNGFVPAVSGEVWVVRSGPGHEGTNCDADIPTRDAPESCWKDERIIEVFAAEGRFLGALEVPEELRLEPRPYIDGPTVVGLAQDDAGTFMVKRYRLIPPGSGQ